MRIERVEDPADPRVAEYVEAGPQGRGRATSRFLAEGRLVVRRLLEGSRFRTRSLLLTEPSLHDLRDAIGDRPGAVYVAPAATIRSIIGFKFHRGCLALGEREPPLPVATVTGPAGPRILLGLEELADPDNVGVVFRNAAAFGVGGVLLSPGSADPLYRKAIRVSMGATLLVPYARPPWPLGLEALRAAGYTLIALTPDRRAEDIDRLVDRGLPGRRLALLVGAEGGGLSERTRGAADLCVRIPMAPGVDSLNAATASGIALHRLASGIMAPGGP